MKRFTTITDLENTVEDMLGDGGDLDSNQIDTVKTYIADKIRNMEGFEYDSDMTDLIEGISERQWNKWLTEAIK
jgi:hypothetical protein